MSRLYIKSSDLLLLAFATAFLSRVLHALGIPAVINFLHLAVVPFACMVALFTNRTKNRRQLSISYSILFGLCSLLAVMMASALLNTTGVINVVLEFLLVGEPFMLLVAIVSIPMSPLVTERFLTWIFRFCLANSFFCHVQKFIWRLDSTNAGYDNMKGIFIAQGAGHYVGAGVALTFGTYYLVTAKSQPMLVRVAIFLFTISHVIISGRRQVFLAFILALVVLTLINLGSIKKAIMYLSGTVTAISFLYWAAYTIFPSLLTWLRADIVDEAINLKTASFRIVTSYYYSSLNWWLGLGPGNTVGRLGGWMLSPLRGYWAQFEPLGATRTSIGDDVWGAISASWLGDKSTFFSPMFSWAGIWGDLGFLGLGVYLYLCYLVWRQVCLDGISKYLLLTAFWFGCFFTWLEEPAYMLLLASFIGLQWQGNQKQVAPLVFEYHQELATQILDD